MMEKWFEKFMYSTRWLLAPIYLGLSLALLALAIKFFTELFHVLPHIMSVSEMDLILLVLTLVDISLVGGLMRTLSHSWILMTIMTSSTGWENWTLPALKTRLQRPLLPFHPFTCSRFS